MGICAKIMGGKTFGWPNVFGSRILLFIFFKLSKCLCDIMSGWQNVSSAKYPGVKMSVRQNFRVSKCLSVKMSKCQNVGVSQVGRLQNVRCWNVRETPQLLLHQVRSFCETRSSESDGRSKITDSLNCHDSLDCPDSLYCPNSLYCPDYLNLPEFTMIFLN